MELDAPAETTLEFVGVQLAVLTAGIHLWLGLPRFLVYVRAGTPLTDVRMVLFLLSAVAVLCGLALLAAGVGRRLVYKLGIVLALGYIVGWLVLGGHGGFAWESAGHSHGNPLATLLSHLFSDPYLVTTKVAEVSLLAVLSVLLLADRSGDSTADVETEGDRTATGTDGG